MLSLSISIIGLGLAIIALENSTLIPPNYKRFIPVAGILNVVTGSFIFAWWNLKLFFRGISIVKDGISKRVLEYFNFEYKPEFGQEEHIDEVCGLGYKFIGNNHADEDTLKKRYKINSKIVKIIYKVKSAYNSVTGYYLIYPLNSEGDQLIQEQLIKTGKDIKISHMTKDFSNASAIYISMLAGKDIHTKAFSLFLLQQDIEYYVNKYKRIKSLYAKPSTKDGLRLLVKYNFKKIGDNSEIWTKSIKSIKEKK